jgi:hypothetical protein
VQHLKSTSQWEDTIFLVIPQASGSGGISHSKVRSTQVILSGGYIEKSLLSSGLNLPHRFKSPLHISDLHSLLETTTTATRAGTTRAGGDAATNEESLVRGNDLRTLLIPPPPQTSQIKVCIVYIYIYTVDKKKGGGKTYMQQVSSCVFVSISNIASCSFVFPCDYSFSCFFFE